jgi:cytochrome P450
MAIEERYPFPCAPDEAVPPEFARRQEEAPLAPATLPSGDAAAIAVRYADVRQILSDPRFTRELNYPGAPRLVNGTDLSDEPDALINMDPPRHTKVRAALSAAFTPRRVEAWRPRATEIAERLLNELAAAGPPGDLVAGYAVPLPIRVICELLGVPHEDHERFRAWSDAFLSVSAYTAGERKTAARAISKYVWELIAARRHDPGSDASGDALIDVLIDAIDERQALTDKELVRQTVGLIIAGHETTATVLSRGVFVLLTRPGQYAGLAADPAQVPAAVEEILRYNVPGDGGLLRVATQDVELPSGVIRQGQAVLPSVAAANQDPSVFPEPGRFEPGRFDTSRPDTSRQEGAHMTFGYGPHYCLGANLARLELQVALAALVRRLPRLELAATPKEIPWRSGLIVRGPRRLPVTW